MTELKFFNFIIVLNSPGVFLFIGWITAAVSWVSGRFVLLLHRSAVRKIMSCCRVKAVISGNAWIGDLQWVHSNDCAAAFSLFVPQFLEQLCVHELLCWPHFFSSLLQTHLVFSFVLVCRSAEGHLHLCRASQNMLKCNLLLGKPFSFPCLTAFLYPAFPICYVKGTFNFSNKLFFSQQSWLVTQWVSPFLLCAKVAGSCRAKESERFPCSHWCSSLCGAITSAAELSWQTSFRGRKRSGVLWAWTRMRLHCWISRKWGKRIWLKVFALCFQGTFST